MDLLTQLTDDQVALLGCAGALIATGSLMCLTYFVGRGRSRMARDRSLQLASGSTRASAQSPSLRTDAKRRDAA